MPDNNEHRRRLAQLAAELTAAWNARDPQAVAALCAADYEGENVGEAAPHRGPAGMAASVAAYLRAFPDLHFTVDDVVIEGERVVQVWRAHATHRGPLLNIPASGRSIQVRGASLLTFRDGKLWRALHLGRGGVIARDRPAAGAVSRRWMAQAKRAQAAAVHGSRFGVQGAARGADCSRASGQKVSSI
jgi:steroid delta-isomerase-like uncharacterized protein